jgi:hypothetical protein
MPFLTGLAIEVLVRIAPANSRRDGLPYLNGRMLVYACDLEAAHDRRGWVEEYYGTLPPCSCKAQKGVQARAVDEDQLCEIELILVAWWERAESFCESRSRGEVQLTG